jgi:hypothetical protein
MALALGQAMEGTVAHPEWYSFGTMEPGNEYEQDSEALSERIAKRLFPSIAQQQSCARHLSRLLAESKGPVTQKMLRKIQQDAIALTMRSP